MLFEHNLLFFKKQLYVYLFEFFENKKYINIYIYHQKNLCKNSNFLCIYLYNKLIIEVVNFNIVFFEIKQFSDKINSINFVTKKLKFYCTKKI